MRRFYLFAVMALMSLMLAACPAQGDPTTGTGTEGQGVVETPAATETNTPVAEATEEPTVEAAEEITGTEGITGTEDITGTEGITGTEDITGTEGITGTGTMTDTQGMGTDTTGMATLNIQENVAYGPYLVDAEGRSLYIYTGEDESMVDTTLWEPVEANDADTLGEGLDETLMGSVARDDGTQQLTYNEYPLYRYTNDLAPGDVMGQGMDDNWWLLSHLGEPIEE
jgi:predicted lipoprotein with Yx(FWY)xxD motif